MIVRILGVISGEEGQLEWATLSLRLMESVGLTNRSASALLTREQISYCFVT